MTLRLCESKNNVSICYIQQKKKKTTNINRVVFYLFLLIVKYCFKYNARVLDFIPEMNISIF